MIVVFDTTVFIENPGLVSNACRLFQSEAPRHGFRLLIPQLVMMEAAGKIRSQLDEAKESLGRVEDALRRLAIRVDMTDINGEIDRAIVNHPTHLNQSVSALGAVIVEFPETPHDEIARRMIRREKPFAQQGEGYRDTLIWETVVSFVQENDSVAYITGNKKDFAKDVDGAYVLADDLVTDLRARNLDPAKLRVYPSLKLFVGEHLQPSVDARLQLQDQLESDEGFKLMVEVATTNAIHQELREGRSVHLRSVVDWLRELDDDVEIEAISIAQVHAPPLHNLHIEDGAVIDSETILGLYCDVDVDVDYSGVHHDHDEESTWGGPHSWSPTLHERGFSDSTTRTVGISLEGTLSSARDSFDELRVVYTTGLKLDS